MIECEFKLKDLASTKHYNVHKQGERWWIFNEDGEGLEVDLDVLYSIIDKYFKGNI